MNTSSTLWILLGIGAVLAVLLLSAAPVERAEKNATAVQQPVQFASTGDAKAAATVGRLTVSVGADRVVGEREMVMLRGEVRAPSGSAVTYRWTADGGLGFFENAVSPTTRYTAPSVCDCEECVILTLTATTASGLRASDSIRLTIRDPLACPTSSCRTGGVYVRPFDPCQPCPQPACPAQPAEACSSPCVSPAPQPGACGAPVVPCPCSAGDCWGGWSADWPFGPQAEHPKDRPRPRITRQYPAQIPEGATVRLGGTIDNPACLSAWYAWSVSKGWLDEANTLEPVYHAPESDRPDGETVTITLSAYDGSGARSYDQIRIRIENTDAQ